MSPRVALPGWGLRAQIYEPLQAALAGDWQAWDWSQTTPSQQLSTWAERLPPGAWLYAWSLSGLLALELACQRPLAGVVLLASSPCWGQQEDWPGMPAQHRLDFTAQLRHSPEAAARAFLALQTQGDAEPGRLRQRLRPLQWPAMQAVGLLDLLGWDLRSRIARIRAPVLVVLAENDALLPVAQAPALRRLGVEVRLLPGSHVLPWAKALPALLRDWETQHGSS